MIDLVNLDFGITSVANIVVETRILAFQYKIAMFLIVAAVK
jgi:hypothetical protein